MNSEAFFNIDGPKTTEQKEGVNKELKYKTSLKKKNNNLFFLKMSASHKSE